MTPTTEFLLSYSPGPWSIDQKYSNPKYPNWREIILSPTLENPAGRYISVTGHIGEGNARLIAAAPDLLTALENTVTAYEALVHNEFDGCGELLHSHLETVKKGYKAIGKAKGETL